MSESLKQFHAFAGRLNWETESRVLERALDNVWRSNGWTSEADHFARDLVAEVSAIPPWEPMKRLTLLSDRLQARYDLSPDQAAQFQRTVMREVGRLLPRHAPVLFKQLKEYLAGRAAGKPFTVEQVAQWSKESEPILADLHDSIERVSAELEPMLSPRGRRFFQRDLASYQKRKRFINAMLVRWEKGQWQPEDWGLQDDPAYGHGARRHGFLPLDGVGQPSASSQPTLAVRMTHPLSYDPSTWFAYVLDFQERFALDPGQKNAAYSVHAELYARARAYAESHAATLDPVPPRDRATDEAFGPIRALFHELQHRLDAIPTSSQREQSTRKP